MIFPKNSIVISALCLLFSYSAQAQEAPFKYKVYVNSKEVATMQAYDKFDATNTCRRDAGYFPKGIRVSCSGVSPNRQIFSGAGTIAADIPRELYSARKDFVLTVKNQQIFSIKSDQASSEFYCRMFQNSDILSNTSYTCTYNSNKFFSNDKGIYEFYKGNQQITSKFGVIKSEAIQSCMNDIISNEKEQSDISCRFQGEEIMARSKIKASFTYSGQLNGEVNKIYHGYVGLTKDAQSKCSNLSISNSNTSNSPGFKRVRDVTLSSNPIQTDLAAGTNGIIPQKTEATFNCLMDVQ